MSGFKVCELAKAQNWLGMRRRRFFTFCIPGRRNAHLIERGNELRGWLGLRCQKLKNDQHDGPVNCVPVCFGRATDNVWCNAWMLMPEPRMDDFIKLPSLFSTPRFSFISITSNSGSFVLIKHTHTHKVQLPLRATPSQLSGNRVTRKPGQLGGQAWPSELVT